MAEGGTGEASGQDDMQSFTIWSRPPSEEDCYIDNTESGMIFFEICGLSVFLYTCVLLTITHEPFYTHLGIEMSGTSFVCGNLNGHHNTELRT